MKKTIIGISGSIIIENSKGFEGYKKSYVNDDYVQSVIRANGIPFIIPFNENKSVVMEMVKNVDGVILSGGHDVDPKFYNEEPLQKLGQTFPERDEFDMSIIDACIKLKKPIFGVCRGFQILNVKFKGSLYQDLSYNKDCFIKHSQTNPSYTPSHSIKIYKGKFFSEIFDDSGFVNSFHHQIIKDVSPIFNVCARANDGVVEAIECIDDEKFIIATQWHPEMMSKTDEKSQEIFNRFIKKASEK